MTASAKTTLGPSPWPARPRKPAKVYDKINPEALGLTDDAPRSARPAAGSKYQAIFAAAYVSGKAIKTPAGTAAAISNLARTWLKRQDLKAQVRSTANYGSGDGTGRVWLFKDGADAQAKAQAGRKRGAA
jgi:hypothetical protein